VSAPNPTAAARARLERPRAERDAKLAADRERIERELDADPGCRPCAGCGRTRAYCGCAAPF
jgi:hypothetical protein